MTLHIPALQAPPVPADRDDPTAAEAERRRQLVESLLTVFVTAVVIAALSVVGVALELG